MNASSGSTKPGENYLLFELTKSDCENEYIQNDPYSEIIQVYNILVLVLAPVNVLLNGLSLKIFGHRIWKKSSMSSILMSLSVFEICFGCSLFFHTITHKILEINLSGDSTVSENLTDAKRTTRIKLLATTIVANHVLSGFLFAFQVARNWSVVLLAAYRYDVICRKLGTMTSFPRERIPLIMSITLTSAGLFALPRIFETKTYICVPTAAIYIELPLVAQNIFYELIYLGIGAFIVQSGGPVLCVCLLSFFVIRKIAIRRRFRRQNQRAVLATNTNDVTNIDLDFHVGTKTIERAQPSGDKLMLALSFTFFVLETPAFFSKILSSYTSKYHPQLDVYFSVIANLLIYLDSTFNAFIYMGSNPTFRQVAKLTFGKSRLTEQGKRYMKRKRLSPPLIDQIQNNFPVPNENEAERCQTEQV